MRVVLIGTLVLALAATVGCSSGGAQAPNDAGSQAAGWSGTSITSAPRNPTSAWTTPQGGNRFSSASTPAAAATRAAPPTAGNAGLPARPAPPTAMPSWTPPAGSPTVAPVPGDPAPASPGAAAGTCGDGKG